MPAKNRIKQYVANSYYHIYNRGVEKRKIFMDTQDYGVFLSYLKEYLLPKNEKALHQRLADPQISNLEKDNIIKQLRMNNFSEEITLLAYCLMPNHFHFMVKQKSAHSIDKFMNSLATRYTMYFNKKYNRVGSLYQGVYKAVSVLSDEQYLHLSRYIHKQALALKGQALQGLALEPRKWQPCSYLEFIEQRKSEWVQPQEILKYFSKTNPSLSYERFIRQTDDNAVIENIILED